MNVKNITWRDLGLSPIYMLLDLRCKQHLDLTKLRQKKMGHMISRDKTCLKTHLKAFEIFDGKSQGAERSRGNWPDLKM